MSTESGRRPGQTPIDFVAKWLCPFLIMGLVSSLVFFLLEVLYQTDGPFKGRLQWILFFFVFGEVLTARLAITGEAGARSKLYGIVLAGLTYLGMAAFVQYPPDLRELSFLFNIILVGVVWWCSHRLTWDCTNLDEDTDMSARGLLQAAGLEQKQGSEGDLLEEPEKADGKRKPLTGLAGWLDRYRRFREKQQKKRTLGVWVVYFSLAALPIFGLGQSLIPLTAPGRRQFAFWLMTVYVACGLGLLLTTCFLGLRRYLRQKGLQMPKAMTGAWLTSGGVLVLVLLVLGAFLPRPYAEYPLIDLIDPAGAKKRQADRLALKGDEPGEGRGQPGETRPDGKEPGGKADDKGKGQSKEGGGKEGKGAQGKEGKGDGEGKGKEGKGGGETKGQDKGNGQSKQGDKNGKQTRGGMSKEPKGNKGQGQQKEMAKGLKEMEKKEQGKSAPQSSQQRSFSGVQQFLQKIAPVMKWIVFGALALIVVIAFLRGGLGFLSNFTEWAKRLLEAWRNFWAGLFGGAKQLGGAGGIAGEAAEEEKEAPVPFSAFANPFDTGKADELSPGGLVRYTFEALEAWARERGLERRPDETALEMVNRIGDEVPALEESARRLGQLHARAEYARGELPRAAVADVRAFWEQLERVALAPLSA
jgi:hypothetical protein